MLFKVVHSNGKDAAMAGLAMAVGVVLTLLGVIGYFASGGASATALIPAGFGILYLILGFIARNPAMRKHAMHGAAVISLIGLVATFPGFLKVFSLIGGETLERPQAVIAQAVMALVCLVFLIFAVRSFIQARRSGQSSPQGS